MQGNAGAARGFLHHLNRKLAAAVRLPSHTLVGLFTGTTGHHGDLVRHNKRGVKTHTKLSNQVRIFLLVTRQTGKEFARTGLGNGAQIIDNFITAHTDTVIADGQGACFLVVRHLNGEFRVIFKQRGIMQAFKAQLVAGIGRVGYQFAQENFAV